jgi:F-type H+-transporting ATPase subunit epsilon
MEKLFKLNICSPSAIILDTEITSLCAPGILGYLGVLADHAPLMTSLKSGTIKYRDKQGATHVLHCRCHGFLEVLHNKVTVLLDS